MSKTGRFQETLIDYIDGVLYENLFAMKLALGGVGVVSGEIPPAAPGYLIRGVGTNWAVLPVGQEGYVLTVASGLPEWLSIAGGGDQTFRLDGALVPYSGIGSYVVPRACSLGDVYITCDSPGISGYTIVDINLVRSGVGETIFTNQASRPTLAFNNTNGWAKGTPDIKELQEGDILVPDIDEAANAAEGLIIVSAIKDRGGDADSFAGPETFLELLDTPYSYTNQAGKLVAVNSTEGGLEFAAAPGVAADFTLWLPDAPPPSPSALDDEFDDSALDPKWTEFDPSGNLTITEDEAGLLLDNDNVVYANRVLGIYQPIPAGDFTIITKLSFLAPRILGVLAGLSLWENPTDVDKGIYVLSYGWTPTVHSLATVRYSNYTTYHSTLGGPWEDAWIAASMYLRIRRLGTMYSFDVSDDGLGWQYQVSSALAFTPTAFGPVLNNYSQQAVDRGLYSFFRYKDSDVELTGILEGARCKFWRA